MNYLDFFNLKAVHTDFVLESRYSSRLGINYGNFAFNLVVKLSVELGYAFLSLRL
jgi:hypothetical protein